MLSLRFPHLALLRRWLAVAALAAAPVTAHAALMLPPPPYRPKDFAVVKKDGLYHIFYIRHDNSKPDVDTEKDLGHAVSADMYSWTQLPAVLPVRDSGWDNQFVWAPTIVQLDSVYYMFYAGVTQYPGGGWEQRIGLATSTDLMTWNRLDHPIYSCRNVPWAWCDTLVHDNGFRDPFVMPDPAAPGHWLMYYSAFPASDTQGMVVGVAASDGDLTEWTDLMPLWITNRQYSFSSIIESPHLFQHGSQWFLFVTMNSGQPLTFFTSPDPTGPIEQWTNRGRLGTMLGIDTNSWYASEYFADGINDYFAFVQYNRVEIYKMFWTGPGTFHLFEPGNFHVQSMTWSSSTVVKGQPDTLSVVATGWQGRELDMQAAEKLPGGGEAPLAIESLGIPASLELTADTTRFVWTSAIVHASGDTTAAETFVVRAGDLTAESKPVTVVPPPPPFALQGLSWSAAAVHTGEPATLSVVAANWSGHSVDLEGVERLPGGGEAALDMAQLGLPASLALTADTTRVIWTARIRRASGDTTTALDLEVRTPDHAVVAPLLHVSLPPPPPPFEISAILWSADSAHVGDPVTLRVVAISWSGHVAPLDAIERMPKGAELALNSESMGLPAMLPLVADTTRFDWIARIRRDTGDTTSMMRLTMHNPDFETESPVLLITQPPPPPPFVVHALRWSADSVEAGQPVSLSVIASGWSGHTLGLEPMERLPGGGESPLPSGSLGLPSALALTADTTRLAWITRIRHASGDTTTAEDLIVRASGLAMETAPLRVTPPPAPPPPLTGDDSGAPPTQDRRLVFRALNRSVLGDRPAFLVDAPQAARARLDVYDLQGRRVRTLADRVLAAGANVLDWDGRDANGVALGRGLYFARISTPFASRTVKIVITRPAGAP